MGFAVLIDIIGSAVIGGILLLILTRLNDSSAKNSFTYNADVIVQENLLNVADIIEFDFKKIGYCSDQIQIPDPTTAITAATDSSITFLADIPKTFNGEGDGVLETVSYSLGKVSDLASTPNKSDRILKRNITGSPKSDLNGIIWFKLSYYNRNGMKLTTPVSDCKQIYTIEIELIMENSEAYDNKYSTAFWRQIRFIPPSIENYINSGGM